MVDQVYVMLIAHLLEGMEQPRPQLELMQPSQVFQLQVDTAMLQVTQLV